MPPPLPAAKPASPPPAARPASPPLAVPVAVAPPVAPVAPVATPVPAAPARDPALVFNSEPDLTVPPTHLLGERRRPSKWRLPLVLGFSLLGAGGLIGLIVLAVSNLHSSRGGPTGPSYTYPKENFSFQAPTSPWKSDPDLRAQLGCFLAFSRSDPPNKMAIAVIDYKDRPPRTAVLLDESLDRLTDYFGADKRKEEREKPAWQPKAPATLEKFEPHEKLAGQPALVIEFEGSKDSVLYAGECWIVQHQGRAYLFFTLAPKGDNDVPAEAREQWAALHKGFGLLDERKGWKPQPRPSESYPGDGYTLSFAKEVWKSLDKEADDKKAVLLLEGHDPKEEREGEASKAGKAAHLRVVELEKQADIKAAAAAARKQLIDRQVAIGVVQKPEDVQLMPAAGGKGDRASKPADIGTFKGHLSKSRMSVTGGTLDRFVVIAAVQLADKVVAVYGDCDWKRREYWEQEFNALLASFRQGK